MKSIKVSPENSHPPDLEEICWGWHMVAQCRECGRVASTYDQSHNRPCQRCGGQVIKKAGTYHESTFEKIGFFRKKLKEPGYWEIKEWRS